MEQLIADNHLLVNEVQFFSSFKFSPSFPLDPETDLTLHSEAFKPLYIVHYVRFRSKGSSLSENVDD